MTLNKNFIITAILIIGLSISIGIAWTIFIPDFGIKGDIITYDKTAWNLSQGRGFTIDNLPEIEAPGYIFFLSGIYRLFGKNYELVKLLQFLFLGIIGVFVFAIAKKFLKLNYHIALLTALTVICWPYLMLYAGLVHNEILFMLFLIPAAYLFLLSQKKPKWQNVIMLGILLGLAALTRFVGLLLPFWIAASLFLFFKFRKRNALKALAVVVAFYVVLIPWSIRNYQQFGSFTPTHSENFRLFDRAFVRLDYTIGAVSLKPGEADFKVLAISRLKNAYLFWNPGTQGTRAQILIEKYNWANYLFLIYKIIFFTILALALFSLKFIRKNKSVAVLWVIVFHFWALHTALYPYPRYTMPIIPFVIILAYFSINYLSSSDMRKRIAG